MSRADDRIIESNRSAEQQVQALKDVTKDISFAQGRQRRLVQSLLAAGITTRFIGAIIGKSHQTVGKMREK